MFGTDTFTGADGTNLSAGTPTIGVAWAVKPGHVSQVYSDANRVRSNSAATGNYMYVTGGPASADYYVQADIVVKSKINYAGICGRMTPASDWGYAVITDGSTWSLLVDAGTTLGTFVQTLTVGLTYTVKLEMIGTTIKAYIDGVERISVTNSVHVGKGKAGIVGWGTFSNTTGFHLDNFTASSISFTANLCVCDGDSITAGIGTNTLPWPTQLATALGATWTVVNKGVSGQTLAQMEADAATDIDGELSVEFTGRRVLIAPAGTNDIYFNADADDTAATTIARHATYWSNRLAAGWPERIACTILPRGGDFSTSTLPAVKATHHAARRLAFNTSVRANYLTYATKLADVAAVGSAMGDAGDELDATYYQADAVHPTNAGATVMKDIIKAAIDAPPPVTGIVVAWPWSVPPLPPAANQDPTGSAHVRADMRRMRR